METSLRQSVQQFTTPAGVSAHLELHRMQGQPMHAHDSIQVTATALDGLHTRRRRSHLAQGTDQGVHLDRTSTIHDSEINANPAEHQMLEGDAGGSFDREFGFRSQFPEAGGEVPHQRAEDDGAAVVFDLRDAAGVGVGQFTISTY